MRKFLGLLLQLNMLYNACRYGLLSAQPAARMKLPISEML